MEEQSPQGLRRDQNAYNEDLERSSNGRAREPIFRPLPTPRLGTTPRPRGLWKDGYPYPARCRFEPCRSRSREGRGHLARGPVLPARPDNHNADGGGRQAGVESVQGICAYRIGRAGGRQKGRGTTEGQGDDRRAGGRQKGRHGDLPLLW